MKNFMTVNEYVNNALCDIKLDFFSPELSVKVFRITPETLAVKFKDLFSMHNAYWQVSSKSGRPSVVVLEMRSHSGSDGLSKAYMHIHFSHEDLKIYVGHPDNEKQSAIHVIAYRDAWLDTSRLIKTLEKNLLTLIREANPIKEAVT